MRVLSRVGIGSFLGLGAAILIGQLGIACSSTPASTGFNQSGGGGNGGAGAHHPGNGGGGEGGTIGTSSLSGPGSSNGGSSSSGISPDAACASSTAEAMLTPLNMYIMFDKSGSMDQNNKWVDATTALKAFFADPGSTGLRVALRFFEDGTCGQCSGTNGCATPEVPLGPLTADPAPTDTQEAALVAAINAHSPGGGTPMSAALSGAEDFATAYQAAHPAEKAIVVLVTDGQPNGCDNDINHIAALAADGVTKGVLTFAVGLQGSSTAQMNQIAAAGGTNTAFFIGTGSNAVSDFLAALQAIRGSSVSCEFPLPMTDDQGHKVDPKKVNVDYTPGGNGNPVIFPQVADASKCGNNDGWYYDDASNPMTITLCPHTCNEVQADSKAKIQILLGCASQGPPH